MRIDNAEFSGSITGTEATAYLSGSFSGSFHGELIGSIESASFATTASHALTASLLLGSVESASYATTASHALTASGYAKLTEENTFEATQSFNSTIIISASVFPEANGTNNGIHDLGSVEAPFRDLYITTSSLNFVKDGVVIAQVNGGDDFIQVGNIIIGTSSISYASGSDGTIRNIITVDTASESNMVVIENDATGSSYTGSFSGSFMGTLIGTANTASHAPNALSTGSVNGNTLTFTKGDGTTFDLQVITSSGVGGESIASLNSFTSSIQSEVDALQAQTGSYLTSSGSVDFDDITNKPLLVSGSGYVSSSIAGQVITFNQADGTTETLTVPAGGGGGESIASLNTFTSSIQSEVDALQNQTASYALTASISGAFSLDGTGVVSGSGYVSSSINGQVITFNQADGTTETITVPAGGGGGESISALNTFTSSVQSEVDALQTETGSYITNVSVNDNTLTIQRQDSSSYNLTVVTSSGGGSTDVLEYNNVVRISSGSASQNNYEMVVAGDVYKNISWSRSSTTLTITHNSHGLAVGDVVHIRNMSVDYVSHPIASVTTNTFTVTVPNSGDTSGTAGVFVPVPRLTTQDGGAGSVVIANPAAGKCNIQTLKMYFTSVDVTTINIDVPAGLDDGFGTNDALGTRFAPLVTYYKLDGGSANLVGTTTITFSLTSNHARYTIAGGSIDTFGASLAMLRF